MGLSGGDRRYLSSIVIFAFLLPSTLFCPLLVFVHQREREGGREMGNKSKDLLRFEHKNSSTSAIESAFLFVTRRIRSPKPINLTLTKSSSLLPFLKAKAYDIELLTGCESNVIEMDLMLGVADLNTPEAVAAVESAIAGNQLVIPLAASSSETESDDNSGDSNFDEDGEDNGNDDDKAYSPMNLETQTDDSSSKSAKKDWSKKHSRIIELS